MHNYFGGLHLQAYEAKDQKRETRSSGVGFSACSDGAEKVAPEHYHTLPYPTLKFRLLGSSRYGISVLTVLPLKAFKRKLLLWGFHARGFSLIVYRFYGFLHQIQVSGSGDLLRS